MGNSLEASKQDAFNELPTTYVYCCNKKNIILGTPLSRLYISMLKLKPTSMTAKMSKTTLLELFKTGDLYTIQKRRLLSKYITPIQICLIHEKIVLCEVYCEDRF